MGNPATGCTCGSGGHPRECKLHPELYRLHIAELNLEGILPDDPEVRAAMDELFNATTEALKIRTAEITRLQKLVFSEVPKIKSYNLRRLWAKKDRILGSGGATEYEVWLRTKDFTDLRYLIKLHTGAIDALRYRRRFVEHELERQHLHSGYGKYPLEDLFDPQGGLP